MGMSGGGGTAISPATTVTGPDAFGAAAAVGTGTLYARNDHDHGLPAAPAVPGPATTVTGPDAYGAAAAVGVGTLYARNDHDHGLPAAPAVPGPATTVTGPDAYGAAAAVGVGTLYARNDHDHGLPAAPAASLTSQQAFLAADTAITTGQVILLTLSLTAGTWLIGGHITVTSTALGDAVTAGIYDQTAASYIKSTTMDTLATSGFWIDIALPHVTYVVASTRNIQLAAFAAATGATAKAQASGIAQNIATHITAIKIA